MLHEGDDAPLFSLPAHDGSMFSLKDYRGQTIVLYFYPKDNTPGCTKEACSFQDHLTQIKKLGAIVVGISTDGLQSHDSFAKKYNLEFPLLSDEHKEVVKKYGVWKKKSMYGKSYYGIERTTFIIDKDGTIKKIFPKVKVENHVEEVVKVLQE